MEKVPVKSTLQWFNLEAKSLCGSSHLLFISAYGGVESDVVA